jgi:hypothetical protein
VTPRAALQALVDALEPCIVAGCGPATRYRGPFPRVYYCDAHGHMCSELPTAEALRAALRVLAEPEEEPTMTETQARARLRTILWTRGELFATEILAAWDREGQEGERFKEPVTLVRPPDSLDPEIVREMRGVVREALRESAPEPAKCPLCEGETVHSPDGECGYRFLDIGDGLGVVVKPAPAPAAPITDEEWRKVREEGRALSEEITRECRKMREIPEEQRREKARGQEPAAPCPGPQESLWTAKPDPMLLPSFESFIDPNVTLLSKACTCCGGHVAIAFRESNQGDAISCCSCGCRWLAIEIRAGSCVLGDVVPCTGKAAGGGG